MIYLEQFSEKHLPKTYNWMLDEDLRRNFLFRRIISPSDHQKWFQEYLLDDTQDINAIYYENEYVGNVGLKNIDKVNHNAETWIYLGESNMKGKGIGKKVYIEFVKSFTFNFHKIYANIAEFNTSSTNMYQKSGFVLEGCFKDQLFFENKYHNLLRYALYL
jgi:RimJ/RimL family protein N-acetyltransferase